MAGLIASRRLGLADLPDLQYLFLQVGRVTPEMVSSLDRMRGLRILCIEETGSDDEDANRQVWREGFGRRTTSRGYETIPAYPDSWIVEIFRQWKQQTGKKRRATF